MPRRRASTCAAAAAAAVVAVAALSSIRPEMAPRADGFGLRPVCRACSAHLRGPLPSSVVFEGGDWLLPPPSSVRRRSRIRRRRDTGRVICRGVAPPEESETANDTAVAVSAATAVLDVASTSPSQDDGVATATGEDILVSAKRPGNETATMSLLPSENATATARKSGKRPKSLWPSFFGFGKGQHNTRPSGSRYKKGRSNVTGVKMGLLGVKFMPPKSKKSVEKASFFGFGKGQHSTRPSGSHYKKGRSNVTGVKMGLLGVKFMPPKSKKSAEKDVHLQEDVEAAVAEAANGMTAGSEKNGTVKTSVSGPNHTLEGSAKMGSKLTKESGAGRSRASSASKSLVDGFAVVTAPKRSSKQAKTEAVTPEAVKSGAPKVSLDAEGISLDVIDPHAPLTLSDLDTVLRSRGYVHRSELAARDGTAKARRGRESARTPADAGTAASGDDDDYGSDAPTGASSAPKVGGRGKGGVAFPQPSVLSYRDVSRGTIVASATLGVVLGSSVNPNLWLVGCVLGVIYGQSLGKTDPNDDRGAVGNAVTNVGRKIAKAYLRAHDMVQTLWFMYRTGQLSYEYYRRYETMDQRFHIQDKIDAWNARFVEGKRKFDEWEKENEVGRRVLAGVRTFWLVNEKSYRKQMKKRPKSKYRLVQYILDAFDWLKRFVRASWRVVTGGDGGEDLRELLRGIRVQVSEDTDLEMISRRAGSAVAALVAVNAIGAVFAISPTLLGALAVTFGILWPDWVGEAARRVGDSIDETRARGRGEKPLSRESKSSTAKPQQPGGKSATVKFHYFLRQDGSKRWYRTGQPVFPWMLVEEDESRGFFDFFRSKEESPKKRRAENKGWLRRDTQ